MWNGNRKPQLCPALAPHHGALVAGWPVREKSCFSLFQVKAVVTGQVRGWDQSPLCSSHIAIIWLVGWVFRTSDPQALCPRQSGHFYPPSYLEIHKILIIEGEGEAWRSLTLVADQTTTPAQSIMLHCEGPKLPYLLEVLPSFPLKSCSPAQAGKEGKLDPRTCKRIEKLPFGSLTQYPPLGSPCVPLLAFQPLCTLFPLLERLLLGPTSRE